MCFIRCSGCSSSSAGHKPYHSCCDLLSRVKWRHTCAGPTQDFIIDLCCLLRRPYTYPLPKQELYHEHIQDHMFADTIVMLDLGKLQQLHYRSEVHFSAISCLKAQHISCIHNESTSQSQQAFLQGQDWPCMYVIKAGPPYDCYSCT